MTLKHKSRKTSTTVQRQVSAVQSLCQHVIFYHFLDISIFEEFTYVFTCICSLFVVTTVIYRVYTWFLRSYKAFVSDTYLSIIFKIGLQFTI